MEEVEVSAAGRAAALIDDLADGQRTLAAAQASQGWLMLEFGAARDPADPLRLEDRAAAGMVARYRPAEFAAMEIGLAIKASKHRGQRIIGIAQRLRDGAPDVWEAWQAGDIDHLKAVRITHAVLRLPRPASKQLLNALVVPVAVCKTAELLGRWLNAFIARYEPEDTDERLHRALADRYAALRPDLDGVSFFSAAMSSLDAAAIDQILNAVAGLAGPDDGRTLQQRRADTLVDLLLGRVSNGCHVTWHENDDDNEDDDNEDDDNEDERNEHHGHGENGEDAADDSGQGENGEEAADDGRHD